MLVCICANYSEAEIVLEIKEGTDTLEKLQDIGICANCCTCKANLEALIELHKGK